MIELTIAEASALIGAWSSVVQWVKVFPPDSRPVLESQSITKIAARAAIDASVQRTLRFEEGNGTRLRVELADEVVLLSEAS